MLLISLFDELAVSLFVMEEKVTEKKNVVARSLPTHKHPVIV